MAVGYYNSKNSSKVFYSGEAFGGQTSYHVALVVRPGFPLKLYLNGVLTLSSSRYNDTLVSNYNETLAWIGKGVAGSIDEIRVWSGALQQKEIVQHTNFGPNKLINTLNASIVDGNFEYIDPDGISTSVYVGTNTSSIQYVISTYFPSPSLQDVRIDTDSLVWINASSNTLSFLTVTGNYSIDEAIRLPSLFVLKLQNANFIADPNIPNYAGNVDSVISIQNVRYSAVVNTGSASLASISCRISSSKSVTSLSGIQVRDSFNIAIDGISIDACGGTLQYGLLVQHSKNVEIANCVVHASVNAGVGLLASEYVSFHHNTLSDSSGAGLECNKSASNNVYVYNNNINGNNGYGMIFGHRSKTILIAYNVIGRNTYGLALGNSRAQNTSMSSGFMTVFGNSVQASTAALSMSALSDSYILSNSLSTPHNNYNGLAALGVVTGVAISNNNLSQVLE